MQRYTFETLRGCVCDVDRAMVCECEDDGFKKKLKPHSTTLLISHLGPSCSLAKRGENLGLATEFPIWDVSPVQLPGLVTEIRP
jgi:hypothetical protein